MDVLKRLIIWLTLVSCVLVIAFVLGQRHRSTQVVGGPLIAQSMKGSNYWRNCNTSDEIRFIFAWTTGHSGSTSLSSRDAYRGMSNVYFAFENAPCTQGRWIRSCGPWASGNFSKDLALVKRWYEETVDEMNALNKSVYVDFGHQLPLGWFKPLATFLGKAMTIVRLRRSRYLTASSFANSKKLRRTITVRPCVKDDDYLRTLFPRHMSKFCALKAEAKWLLWVDEVEAQWYHIKQNYQKTVNLFPVEFNYIQPPSGAFQVLPYILGCGEGINVNKNVHVKKSRQIDEKDILNDRKYKETLEPNTTQMMWIAEAQF